MTAANVMNRYQSTMYGKQPFSADNKEKMISFFQQIGRELKQWIGDPFCAEYYSAMRSNDPQELHSVINRACGLK